jgi:hypothetical protein
MKIPRDTTGTAPPGGIQRVIGAIAVLFLLLGGAAPAAAQAIRLLQFDDIGGAVEAGFFTNLQDRTRTSSSGSQFDRVELSQLLRLDTHGYIYHPRFLTFDTGLRLEAIEGLAGQSDNRLLGGGDFRFNFLERHPNSLSIYGRYLESEYARPFSETYNLTNQLYGATFFQKWGWIPFDLSYQHSSSDGGLDNQLDDSRDKIIFDGRYQIGERSDGRLEYDLAFEDIQNQNIRRQHLVATNVSSIGDAADKMLRTNFRFLEETNGRDYRTVGGNTNFDWKHTDNLRTQYIFDGRWSDSNVQSLTNLNGTFFLTHQLYDSLETDLELFSTYEDASFRTRNEFGGRIAENYLKRLGDWGLLNISVSPHASITFNRLEEDTAFIFDERHRMVLLQPVLLRQPDIIASSIVVTDQTGSIVYVEGLAGDYTVEQVGDGFETRLRRTPISGIADGELVLVDYEYETVGDNDTLTVGVAVHTSLAFLEHWNVYAGYDTLDFHVLSGDEDDLRFNSFDRYTAGLEFNSLWFSAKTRFEDNDAKISPFWSYTGSVSFFTYGVQSWNGRLSADYSYVDQGNSDQTVNRFSVSGVASKRFFNRGFLEAEGSWLRGRWSGQQSQGNDIDAVHLKLRYSWWYGKIEIKAETGFAQLLRPTEDRSVFRADLRVRRVF